MPDPFSLDDIIAGTKTAPAPTASFSLDDIISGQTPALAPTPPTVVPPEEPGQPILGLPQNIQTPFGSFNPTDIPVAGFFLNQKLYATPSQKEADELYTRTRPTVYNPLLPLGIDMPISSDTPVIGGLAESIGQAQSPTTPDMASAAFRDLPVVGEVSRIGEAALNLLNQTWKTVGEPGAGLAAIGLKEGLGALTGEPEGSLKRAEQRSGLTLAEGPGAWQEIGRAALAEAPELYRFAVPMVFDPLTYVGGGPVKMQQARITARTNVPVANIAKASPLERIAKYGFLRSPVSGKDVAAVGEMGLLSKETLGLKPNTLLENVLPWLYTDRSKALELVENSISGLLAKSQFTDADQTYQLLLALKDAATQNGFAPLVEQFPDMVKGFRSYEGQRLVRALAELDIARAEAVLTEQVPVAVKAITDGSLPKEALEKNFPQWIKDVFEAKQAGRLKIDEHAGNGVELAVKEAAKYKMLADATDSMGQVAQKVFNLTKDENLAIKIRDTVKNLEANLFIGFSPVSVINNLGNNMVSQVLHGLNPFGVSKYADRMWKAWGMEPGGAFRKVQENALRQLGMETRGAGFAGPVKGRQWSPFLKVYSWLEDQARRNIWGEGTSHAYRQAVKQIADQIPDDVALALRAADPSGELLKTLKGAIRAQFTPQDVLDFMFNGKMPVTLDAQLGDLARQLNLSEDALMVFMHQSGAWDGINTALAKSKNATEFREKMAGLLDEMRGRVERARTLQRETLPVEPKPVAPVPTGAFKTVAELQAQSVPFDQFVLSPEHARIWSALNHWGEYVPTKAINGWIEKGTTTENMVKSVAKARSQGKVWPDALTEFYQIRANAAFQALADPDVPAWLKAFYEEHLKMADALMRTLNDNQRGLDFMQLEKGPTNVELRVGGKLGSESRYVQDYAKRTGAVGPNSPRYPAGTVPPATPTAGGAVRPVGNVQVSPAAGTGGVPSGSVVLPALSTEERARLAALSAAEWKPKLTGLPDRTIQFYSKLADPEYANVADAARQLIAERADVPAAGTGPVVPIARAAPPTAAPAAAKFTDLAEALQAAGPQATLVLKDGTVLHVDPNLRRVFENGVVTQEGRLVQPVSIAELRDAQGELAWGKPISQKIAPPTAAPATERRTVEQALRQSIDSMLPADKDTAIQVLRQHVMTNPVTGSPSAYAYTVAPKQAIQVHSDVDALKWINDNLGHGTGDELLRAKAKALKDEGVEFYHIGGDEFYAQFATRAEAEAALKRVQERLARTEITWTNPDGTTVPLKGLGFSYGIGESPDAAESALQSSKSARLASGERAARGEPPPILREVVPGRAAQEVGQALGQTAAPVTPVPKYDQALQNLKKAVAEAPDASGLQADELVAARYAPVVQVLEQLTPDKLDAMYGAAAHFAQKDAAMNTAHQVLETWAHGDLTAAMTDARTAAARIGDWYVQRNILNYSARTNFDEWLSWVYPFAYWPRATATNYLMEALNRPALITAYVRAKERLDQIQEDEGFPKRFKGAIPVPMPFVGLAPWLTGKLFFDPLKDWLPIDRFTTEPLKTLGYLQPNTTDIADEIRRRMASGEIATPEGEAALKQMTGNPIWDNVAAKLREQQAPDALDVGSMLFSAHFPLDWAHKIMQGRPQDISYLLPISRQIKGGTAILQAAFPQFKVPGALAGPEGPQGGLDIEGALRTKFGLPSGDATLNYRVDRMIASMSLDGSVSPNQARLALIERKGKVYEEAVRRAAIETGIGSLSGFAFLNSRVMAKGEQQALDAQQSLSDLQAQLARQAGLDPEKATYDEIKVALQKTKGADGQPLWAQVSRWYQDHPEYKPRLALFDTVEARVSNWLSDSIWERYLKLSALDRRMFSDQNPDFKAAFANKQTRQKPANIPTATLEKWNALLGGYNPQIQSTAAPSVADQVALLVTKGQTSKEYLPQDPKLAAQYQVYLSELTKVRDTPEYQAYIKRLNAIESVQNQYYALPAGAERRAFLAQHPELQEYWTWSRDYKANNPVVRGFFAFDAVFWKEHPDLAKLLGRAPSTTSTFTPFVPYSGGRAPFTPYARRGSSGARAPSGAGLWDQFAASVSDPELVTLIQAWLTLSPGDGLTLAKKNPKLARWLAQQNAEYLAKLRQSYLLRLRQSPDYQDTRRIAIKRIAPPKTMAR